MTGYWALGVLLNPAMIVTSALYSGGYEPVTIAQSEYPEPATALTATRTARHKGRRSSGVEFVADIKVAADNSQTKFPNGSYLTYWTAPVKWNRTTGKFAYTTYKIGSYLQHIPGLSNHLYASDTNHQWDSDSSRRGRVRLQKDASTVLLHFKIEPLRHGHAPSSFLFYFSVHQKDGTTDDDGCKVITIKPSI